MAVLVLVLVLVLAPGALLGPATGHGQGLPTGQNRVQVELLPEPSTARPGEPFQAVLRMRIAPGWHTYWMNPGDSGLATALKDETHRDAAVLTFLVTLSGVSLLGIGSAFWGVVAGTMALLVQQWRAR